MKTHTTNEQRTDEYLKKFDREKVLKLLIKEKSPVIFDVGANNGSSLAEFKAWWPDATVHCFEPQQECWDELEERATHYLPGSVVINKVGAGATASDGLTFYTHDLTTGQSGFNRINTKSCDSIRLQEVSDSQQVLAEYEASLNHARTVPLVRLDSYLVNSSIDKVSLLKIDTQGYEPEVLSGLGARLSDIDVVITELMFYDFYERSLSFSDIEKFLLPAGFKLYDISHVSKNPMNGRTDWVDVIYVNERVKQAQKNA
jgi:FkbM family methyltransferase